MESMKVGRSWVPPASTYCWGKTLKSQIVDSTTRMPNTGRSSGKVMAQNDRHGPAPSTRAALSSSVGKLFKPASTDTAMNGNECQTTTKVRIEKNDKGELNHPYPVQSERPNNAVDQADGSALNSHVTRPLVSSKIHFQVIVPVRAGVAHARSTQPPTNAAIRL